MHGYNRVNLVGVLHEAPEYSITANDKRMCLMKLKVIEKYRDKTSNQIFDLAAWNNLAEHAAKLLKKGSPILIDGKLRINHWRNKKGILCKTVIVNVMTIKLLGDGKEFKDLADAKMAFEFDPY